MMSYIERVIYVFLRDHVFGGIAKLKEKKYLPFTVITVSIMLLNTVVAILYGFNIFFDLDFIMFVLMFELFLSFATITSGLLIGRLKNPLFYFLIPICIYAVYILLFLFIGWSQDYFLFQIIKLIFFILWAAITSVSLFFLTIYFFTSFPKKVITLGMNKEHIFLSPILKIIVLVSIPFYIYLLFLLYLGNLIVGSLGLLTMILILVFFYKAPKKEESRPGIMNFTMTLGFYNITIFFHLLMSFSTLSTSTTSFLIDIVLVFMTVLYIVQSMTKRISSSPARLKPHENPVTFQTRLYLTDKLKKVLGEPGTVLLVMGIAIGYHVVTLNSFFIESLTLITEIFPPYVEFSAIYHRIYLLISFLVIIIFTITYFASERAKDLLIDKYTFKQVFKYIIGFFKSENGEPTLAEMALSEVGKKVNTGIKTLSDMGKKFNTGIKSLSKKKETTENNTQQ